MYLTKISPIVTIFIIGLLSSCQKEKEVLSSENDILSSTLSIESSAVPKAPLKEVNLGLAGEFAILSQSGITDVYPSIITGDVGSSPITGAAILVTCTEVAGTIYSVNASFTLCCK